ncbi:ubiquitin carboxyl-terminal hydrolase 15-like [Asterias rubens]|uniref:ubiquitin carboxyl-terminal hydrolase 15-like n=1 Tax=Asterias rubens TaxID=7604 RepID=UPI00145540A6|nr:ubiquitin carboxyl-terminal hydrolase 15-like [Asterias rubens]
MAEGGGPPELQAQKNQISDLLKTSLKKGDIWYLLDSKWFKQWKKYVGYDSWDMYNLGNETSNPGPIDNSGLFVEGTTDKLKENLIDDLDYVLLPADAWEKLTSWYGTTPNEEPIKRKVVEYGMFVKHCKVEVYLMELKLSEHGSPDNCVSHQFSKADTIETIEKEMKKQFNISEDRETRLWNKYMSNTYEHLSKKENTVQDAGLYQGQVLVIEQKNEDGNWPRQVPTTSSYSSTKDSSKYISSSTSSRSSPSTYSSYSGNSYSSYSSSSNYDYNNGSSRSGLQPGLCGLSNLGNTCFMNSALQCMSNVPLLSEYFLSESYKKEMNFNNPLGMHGEIAKSYADLIKQMWSGSYSYTVPRNFKMQVGRFAPQFSGFQQQDSQELLAFLLDGLHEDLNRIQKKPYIEMKESNGRPDELVAKEAWANHRRRNDSIIVDLFHGQFKSTLVCPECSKVSVTFDPFCFLSLPLPIKKERSMEIVLIRLDPKCRPQQMKVVVPKLGMVYDICKAVSKVTKISPDKMVVTDVYNHRFHIVFPPNDRIKNITDKDDIYVYEVPVNVADDPEYVILPVYLREKSSKSSSYSYSQNSYNLFGQPMLVPVPRKNIAFQELYRLILNKMSRYVSIPENENWLKDDNDGNEIIENGETDMDSDSDSQENNGAEENGRCGNLNNEKKEDKKGSTLFGMTLVNSYGSAVLAKLKDDGNPIKFTNRSYVALDWYPKAKDKFYGDEESEAYDIHESMNYQSTSRRQQIDLSDCINLFITEETLEREDSWYCPECKKHQEATKKFDLWRLPKILVVHLKRFSYTRFWRDKLDTVVNFPLEDLDMSQYVINPNDGPYQYDLGAVVNHYGGLGGGHYFSYAKNVKTKQWYNFDDSSVSKVDADSVVTKGAYVLFYIRKDCQDTSDRSGIPASLSQAEPEDDAELSNGALTNGQQSSSGDLSEDGDEMDTN